MIIGQVEPMLRKVKVERLEAGQLARPRPIRAHDKDAPPFHIEDAIKDHRRGVDDQVRIGGWSRRFDQLVVGLGRNNRVAPRIVREGNVVAGLRRGGGRCRHTRVERRQGEQQQKQTEQLANR